MQLNDYPALMRKYRRLRLVTAALALSVAAMLYMCYDYTVFKCLIAGHYIFTDALDEVYAQALGEENVKGYFQDFDRMVISVVTERLREASGDAYTYLYTPQSYEASKETDRAYGLMTSLNETGGGGAILTIPNISENSRKFVLSRKEELSRYRDLTIDLRGNYGGMLNDYYKMAGLFLNGGATIGYENTRFPLFTRHIRAKGGRYFDFDSITILQDGRTASSAEGFIMALKENLGNVELMGGRTFGKGIGQITIPLTGGYAVKATVMLIATPDGGTIHGVGIEPDRPGAG